MKRDCLRHPKVYDLAARLGCDRPSALGYLTLLWDFAGEVSPQGDVGKWADTAIASACDWRGAPDEYIAALVGARWLDVSEVHRLIVHDWPDHCEDFVRAKLKRRNEGFLDCYHSGDSVYQRRHQQTVATPSLRRSDDDATPKPLAAPSRAKPEPSPATVGTATAAVAMPATDDAVMVYRCDGSPSTWALREAQVRAWQDVYPRLDVAAECRKAAAWLEADGGRRKTAKGMPRFLVGWLNRATDHGGGGNGRIIPTIQSREEREAQVRRVAQAIEEETHR